LHDHRHTITNSAFDRRTRHRKHEFFLNRASFPSDGGSRSVDIVNSGASAAAATTTTASAAKEKQQHLYKVLVIGDYAVG
jgi:hypothetical protein